MALHPFQGISKARVEAPKLSSTIQGPSQQRPEATQTIDHTSAMVQSAFQNTSKAQVEAPQLDNPDQGPSEIASFTYDGDGETV